MFFDRLLTFLLAIHAVFALDLPFPSHATGKSPNGIPYTIRPQNASLCDAGTKHWTGTVSVSKGKNLFFCKISIHLLLSTSNLTIPRVLPKP